MKIKQPNEGMEQYNCKIKFSLKPLIQAIYKLMTHLH